MEKKRVVITGMGVVTALGEELNEFWNNIVSGQSGISLVESFDTTNYTTKIAGEIKDFNPLNYMSEEESSNYDRFTQFGLAGTKKALKDAGFDTLSAIDPNRIGVLVGSGIGGAITWNQEIYNFRKKISYGSNKTFMTKFQISHCTSAIAQYLGVNGPSGTMVTACAAGNHSIGEAYQIIKNNKADIMICGGTEASINPAGFGGFTSLRAMSTRNSDPQQASRPFDRDRDGFVMAEGSGILILESLEHALNRKARIYAEVVGFGMSGDAYHITEPRPDGEGAKQSIISAMLDANIESNQIDYVNTHGTSTPLGDIAESNAIKKALGAHAYKASINSSKSMTGHLVAAAGGVEAIISTMVLNKQIVPPTINIDNQDPECDLDYTPNKAREREVNFSLSNSFGFGGHNSTLILKKFNKTEVK
ncbi:beta-ketoacyl-ACP synthase II [Jeotgalibacillus proteolyticus]|uniref:3-oxoacyl-[acyl-carrier-protein] synthase 2 n=1 Tax=Jeotgalibacillus proteolyticus TaxID=2082395 RepID=A0A2S5G6Y6_9BACL|nr:beta-ketoacyl-ACP synthase II [Jeotgalibacillus proteolyticus]PPA68713.1 beta-ketoacyl-[acyl-carrier-protein] synthase II [Jeotgalibacillus proteolyticus]PPA68790.1 beta-ketoacyl-[acyl-carrier-protein] synthase II [Jeotgalibacillus proteolyticus]